MWYTLLTRVCACVWAQALGAEFEMTDGERLPLAVKDLGSSELYPQVGIG